jgi:hypothetical protein
MTIPRHLSSEKSSPSDIFPLINAKRTAPFGLWASLKNPYKIWLNYEFYFF